jgi:hypothetical protein
MLAEWSKNTQGSREPGPLLVQSVNPNQLVYLPRPHRVKKVGGIVTERGKVIHHTNDEFHRISLTRTVSDRPHGRSRFDASLDLQAIGFPSNSILAACFASPSSFSLQSMCANS